MNCDFKVKYPDGELTYFKELIAYGIVESGDAMPYMYEFIFSDWYEVLSEIFEVFPKPKIHTLRKGNRWRPGMKIHMTNYGRSKKRYQFALLECVSVQEIELIYDHSYELYSIAIDDTTFLWQAKDELVKKISNNDGFRGMVNRFHEWFFGNAEYDADTKQFHWVGQCIHWTNFKY